MKILLALALVFSLLTATFASAAAGPDIAPGSGCASMEAAAFCIDPQMLPAQGGTSEKSSKCLGPYLASTGIVVCRAGGPVLAGLPDIAADGLSPRHPQRPPRA